MLRDRSLLPLCLALALTALLTAGMAGSAGAQAVKTKATPLDELTFADERLRAVPDSEPADQAASLLPAEVRNAWAGFLAGAGGEWLGHIDRRTGRIDAAEGAGIPWIPGHGNQLSRDDVAAHLAGAPEVGLPALERIARSALPRLAPVLGVDPAHLKLHRGRSGQVADYLWYVDFDVERDGLVVEGARVVFRVNNGNLIQIATENLPAPGAAVPPLRIEKQAALKALDEFVGGFGSADTFVDGGSLHLLPIALPDAGTAEGFAFGRGRGIARAWQFIFRRKGVTGTWRARVDATHGDLLDFVDLNRYGQVTGGVYLDSYAAGAETVMPMPWADLSTGGAANSAGLFDFTGTPVTSTLRGPYVSILDYCGDVSQSTSGPGRIAFGTSGGTDCVTPGTGGAGNTHAARTQFFHINRAKEIARGWLPGNSWLNGQLGVVVNYYDTCNANWNYTTINFFLSSASCGNSGEIAGVALHEYGHALDSNDGSSGLSDYGTGETYGDFTAALTLHDSCVGQGFWKNQNCQGYGDACTSCTAVRDIDWARHASNTPHTVTNFTQQRCDYGYGYDGPCGREGHCESYVSSEALWDLAARDLPSPGGAAAWAVAERLWYLSRPTASMAFTCLTSTTPWTSNGCAAGSLWRTLRAVDDDDGNLANGTPHSCHLFAAFNRHGIACPTDPGASTCFSGCTPAAARTVSLTPGVHQVEASWDSAGAGMVYDVYRNDMACDAGFTKVANDVTGTSFTDTGVAGGGAYFYQVIAHPAGNEACGAPPSACKSVSPAMPACPALPAPTGLTAQASGLDRIQLSWSAVPGATGYLIYRAAASDGPYSEVGSVAGTSFLSTGLEPETTYFYQVRAFAACESEASAAVSATTGSCRAQVLYANDFESGSGLADWTAASLGGIPPHEWRGIQQCAAHSGTGVFRFGGTTCTSNYSNSRYEYAAPQGPAAIKVLPGSARARLSFWHRWSFESYYDGGYLTLGLDGGTPVLIPGQAILSGASYNGSAYNGQEVFTGAQSSFVQTVVDLDKACNLATGSTNGCGGHTLQIRFVVIADSVVSRTGWFLDDVEVTACTPYNCTGVPAIGAATVPGDNAIQVSWSQGAPPSSSFNVFRAVGTCAAAGPFSRIAGGVGGTSRLDTDVSGGTTYAYRVSGLDSSGVCETDPSGCVEATATGLCTLPPVFAGVTGVGDTHSATCGLAVSWAPASASCNGAVTYNVYRSTSPGFTPSPANRVIAGLSSTSFLDLGPLTGGVTYYYIVRAVDGSNGHEDTNTAQASARATGPVANVSIADTFEGSSSGGGFDGPGWSHAALSGGADWTWTTAWARNGHAWFSQSQGAASHRVLTSPVFRAGPSTTLSFWHTYQFESCWDGGTLEISSNGGATWQVVPDGAFTAGGFTDTILAASNPITGRRAWCRGTLGAMTQVTVDLSGWSEQTVQLRWHAGDDSSVANVGWYVDEVTIANAEVVAACSVRGTAADFYTVTPCRLVDTRRPDGPTGGPILAASGGRKFVLAGSCGIPSNAVAVSANITVVAPAAAGFLVAFPGDRAQPLTSSLNFRAGQTRANNAVLGVTEDGTATLEIRNGASAGVHVLVDVNGYFAPPLGD